MDALFEWMREHGVIRISSIVGVAMFVLSLVGLPFLVAAVPADYFEHRRTSERPRKLRHPALHVVLVVLRNVVGWMVLLSGVAMLVLPGQGVIMILVGLWLVSFPGKRRLELAILRRKSVTRVLQWMRKKMGKEPLRIWNPRAARASRQATAKS